MRVLAVRLTYERPQHVRTAAVAGQLDAACCAMHAWLPCTCTCRNLICTVADPRGATRQQHITHRQQRPATCVRNSQHYAHRCWRRRSPTALCSGTWRQGSARLTSASEQRARQSAQLAGGRYLAMRPTKPAQEPNSSLTSHIQRAAGGSAGAHRDSHVVSKLDGVVALGVAERERAGWPCCCDCAALQDYCCAAHQDGTGSPKPPHALTSPAQITLLLCLAASYLDNCCNRTSNAAPATFDIGEPRVACTRAAGW